MLGHYYKSGFLKSVPASDNNAPPVCPQCGDVMPLVQKQPGLLVYICPDCAPELAEIVVNNVQETANVP